MSEKKELKRILVTTMSVSRETESIYYYNNKEGKAVCCNGLLTTDPGSKYILHKHPIDEIIAIGTKATITDKDVLKVSNLETEFERLEEKLKADEKLSYFEQYKYNIIRYLRNPDEKSEKLNAFLEAHENVVLMKPHPENVTKAEGGIQLPITFVREQVEDSDIDNISEIVHTIYGSGEYKIELYIDVQGGNRTSIYVRNAALAILNNQHQNDLEIKETIATNWKRDNEKNEIVDETQRYKILDLVSGMNAFIQYGKADMIQKYCSEISDMRNEKESNVDKLVDCMVKIDDAISLCDMTTLSEAVAEMASLTEDSAKPQENTTDFVENIFQILAEGIREDYGDLVVNAKVDYLELISWCTRKDFIQQALTLIEDKMPEVYFDKNVLSYRFIGNNGESDTDRERRKKSFLKALGHSYESNRNKIFYHLKYALDGADKTYTYRNVDKHTVETAREDLLEYMEQDDYTEEQFLTKYCEFRKQEWLYEKKGDMPIDYETILVCCEKQNGKTYTVSPKNRPDVNFTITFWANENLDTDNYNLLEQQLFLHEALKNERNCCNHASEKGIRLPIEVVKRAIKIYVQNAKKIIGISNPS